MVFMSPEKLRFLYTRTVRLFVPYSILGSKSKSGVSLKGSELPIEDFTNWAELPPDTGEIYYEVKPGIMIDPDNATLLNHGKEQDWTSEPIEI